LFAGIVFYLRITIHQSRKGGGKEMKKFIALSILGLLIMAFSATVYAQPKLTFSARGYIEFVTYLEQNRAVGAGGNFATFLAPANMPDTPFLPASSTGAWNRTQSYWEERARLIFDFIMDKSLSGTVGFELDSSRMGEGNVYTQMGAWNTDQTVVEIMYAYITAALPYIGIPIPMTVRAGIQPLATRPNVFLYTDGPAITGTLNIDPVLIGITVAKPFEGKEAVADDIDVYGLTASAKLGTISVGGYGYYYNMNTYPLNTYSTVYGVTNPFYADMWWFGLYSDGKLGPINYNFDAVMDYGKVKIRDTYALALPVGADKKVKYRGFAGQLKITYPWEKFAFGALGMYATGADLNKTDRYGMPGEDVANIGTYTSKVGAYVIPPGSEEWAIWGESMVTNNNYITGSALPATMSPLGQYGNWMTRGAIGGTWVAQLFASVSPVPWYKATLKAMYIGDTTKHGNTMGNATDLMGYRDDKGIGWEFNLLNDIKIYNNLTWSVGGGILVAGDAFDQSTGVLFFNESPKNPWIIATKLRYDF
jgi:hypothetical protein